MSKNVLYDIGRFYSYMNGDSAKSIEVYVYTSGGNTVLLDSVTPTGANSWIKQIFLLTPQTATFQVSDSPLALLH